MSVPAKILFAASLICGAKAFAICPVFDPGAMFGQPPQFTCVNAERSILDRFEIAQQFVGSNLFQSCISEIQTYSKDCKVDLGRMKLAAPMVVLERRNDIVFFQRAKEKMESAAKFGEVLEKDYEDYKLYAARVGMSVEDIEKKLAKFKKENNQANERERKQCTSVDLSKGNQFLSEPRNQDSVGWCYAFTAADLLSHKLGKKVSAADLAVAYNADSFVNKLSKKYFDSSEGDIAGGWSGSSIEKIKEKGGACLEENLSSEDNGYGDLKGQLRKLEASGKNQASCSSAVASVFPQMNYKDFAAISKSVGRDQLMTALSDKACGPRIDISKFKVQEHIYTKRADKFSSLDEQLAKKNPVGIYYDITRITNSSGPSSHASVVVGRRFNEETKACEYLVKNSWGTSCDYYPIDVDCSKGSFWAPKTKLSEAIFGTIYVE